MSWMPPKVLIIINKMIDGHVYRWQLCIIEKKNNFLS